MTDHNEPSNMPERVKIVLSEHRTSSLSRPTFRSRTTELNNRRRRSRQARDVEELTITLLRYVLDFSDALPPAAYERQAFSLVYQLRVHVEDVAAYALIVENAYGRKRLRRANNATRMVTTQIITAVERTTDITDTLAAAHARLVALTRALNVAISSPPRDSLANLIDDWREARRAHSGSRYVDRQKHEPIPLRAARAFIDAIDGVHEPSTGRRRGVRPQRPVAAARILVGLAASTLPAQQRLRYLEEFAGELRDQPRRRQLGYSVRILLRSYPLRRALRGAALKAEQ